MGRETERAVEAWLERSGAELSGPALGYKKAALIARATRLRWAGLCHLRAKEMAEEMMSIATEADEPVRRACEALEAAGCDASYSPEPGVPSVERALSSWAAWVDESLLPGRGELAARRARGALIRMERRELERAARSDDVKPSDGRGWI